MKRTNGRNVINIIHSRLLCILYARVVKLISFNDLQEEFMHVFNRLMWSKFSAHNRCLCTKITKVAVQNIFHKLHFIYYFSFRATRRLSCKMADSIWPTHQNLPNFNLRNSPNLRYLTTNSENIAIIDSVRARKWNNELAIIIHFHPAFDVLGESRNFFPPSAPHSKVRQ